MREVNGGGGRSPVIPYLGSYSYTSLLMTDLPNIQPFTKIYCSPFLPYNFLLFLFSSFLFLFSYSSSSFLPLYISKGRLYIQNNYACTMYNCSYTSTSPIHQVTPTSQNSSCYPNKDKLSMDRGSGQIRKQKNRQKEKDNHANSRTAILS